MDHNIKLMEDYAKKFNIPIMLPDGIEFLLQYINNNNINGIPEKWLLPIIEPNQATIIDPIFEYLNILISAEAKKIIINMLPIPSKEWDKNLQKSSWFLIVFAPIP